MNTNTIEWTPLDGIVLEAPAMQAVTAIKNILVTAGPGSGKTELLAQKACYIFQCKKITNNHKILAISFKKDAAVNLSSRVEKRFGSQVFENFHSMTYDAFAKRVLDQFIYAIPDDFKLSPFYQIELNINKLISTIAEKIYGKEMDKTEITKLSNRLNSTLISSIGPNGKAVWSEMLALNTVSFPMITLLAIHIVQSNPMIKKCFRYMYDYVFLDEFQDTTTIQYELIKSIFKDSLAKITAVGDRKQRIMAWAGADKDIFPKFELEFDPDKIELLFNYRSAPKLLKLQKEVYSILNEDQIDIHESAHWSEDDGVVKLVEFKNEVDESIFLLDNIKAKLSSGVSPKDICIIVKQTPPIYAKNIIECLGQSGIKARVENEYQDLVKENVVVIIFSVLRLVFKTSDPESWEIISDYFEHSLSTELDLKKMKEIDRYIKNINIKFQKKLDEEKLNYLLIEILEFLSLDKLKSLYREYSQGDYLDQCIKKMASLLWNEYSLVDDGNMILAIDNFIGYSSIPIMTIHKSKGLEYKVVYFVGIEDSAFWNFKSQPLEDKCAFFVALSRAKQEVYFTFCHERNSAYSKTQTHNNINEIYNLLKNSRNSEYVGLYPKSEN